MFSQWTEVYLTELWAIKNRLVMRRCLIGTGSRTRTYEALRREIYSLLLLGLEPRTYGLQNRCSSQLS